MPDFIDNFTDDLPAAARDPESAPSVVVPYSFLPVEGGGPTVFPTALYEYLYSSAMALPGVEICRFQCFVMALFPHPIVGFNLEGGGGSDRIMAVVLCEEVDGDESSLLPTAELLKAGGKLTSVTGWLCPSHEEARTMWADFIAPPSFDDDEEDDDDDDGEDDPDSPVMPPSLHSLIDHERTDALDDRKL